MNNTPFDILNKLDVKSMDWQVEETKLYSYSLPPPLFPSSYLIRQSTVKHPDSSWDSMMSCQQLNPLWHLFLHCIVFIKDLFMADFCFKY